MIAVKKRRITRSYYQFYYEKFKGLLKSCAFKHAAIQSDTDDNFDIACHELLYAMIYYQPIGSLITFLYSRIDGGLRHYRSQNTPFPIVEHDIADNRCYETDLETSLFVEEILSSLPPLERIIVKRSCMDGVSLKEISIQNNISKSLVYNIQQKALQRLRKFDEVSSV